eukprot:1886151-Pleurochrysis_carterae.AAC.1
MRVCVSACVCVYLRVRAADLRERRDGFLVVLEPKVENQLQRERVGVRVELLVHLHGSHSTHKFIITVFGAEQHCCQFNYTFSGGTRRNFLFCSNDVLPLTVCVSSVDVRVCAQGERVRIERRARVRLHAQICACKSSRLRDRGRACARADEPAYPRARMPTCTPKDMYPPLNMYPAPKT